jgi:hypothetical protein
MPIRRSTELASCGGGNHSAARCVVLVERRRHGAGQEEAAMPAMVWVIGAVVLLVALLLALDWFTAGRTKRRILVRAGEQGATDVNVGYGAVIAQSHSTDIQTGGFG